MFLLFGILTNLFLYIAMPLMLRAWGIRLGPQWLGNGLFIGWLVGWGCYDWFLS